MRNIRFYEFVQSRRQSVRNILCKFSFFGLTNTLPARNGFHLKRNCRFHSHTHPKSQYRYQYFSNSEFSHSALQSAHEVGTSAEKWFDNRNIVAKWFPYFHFPVFSTKSRATYFINLKCLTLCLVQNSKI